MNHVNQQSHVTEEQMVLHYYGEEQDRETEAHLADCPDCRSSYRSLQILLNAVDSAPVPSRSAGYGASVWKRLEPKLTPRHKSWWRSLRLTQRDWVLAALMASLLAGAFLTGRYSSRSKIIGLPPVTPVAQNTAAPVRERVLLVAVGDYLERSQMVLVELANAPGTRPLNIASERRRAEDLLEENRLYRQTAASTGDAGVATVLDDLERVLLEVAHSPATLSGPEVQQLQKRLEDQGVLFKIRVLGSRVQQRESDLSRQTKSNL